MTKRIRIWKFELGFCFYWDIWGIGPTIAWSKLSEEIDFNIELGPLLVWFSIILHNKNLL